MVKRESEKEKRAEDPEKGDLDTSSDREAEDEGEGEAARAAVTDNESDETESEDEDVSEDDADDEKADSDSEDEDEDADDEKADSDSEDEDDAEEPKAAAEADDADGEPEEDEDDAPPPAQLGAQRYVMAAFFFGALLFAYLLGRGIDGLWQSMANRDWLVEMAPIVASVPDDDKAIYATIAGGVIALVVAFRTSRKPHVKQWSEDVSSELLKVKWPSRKDVYASTVVVLSTSAVAVVYLFLLDRFWGFVTNQIYGSGL